MGNTKYLNRTEPIELEVSDIQIGVVEIESRRDLEGLGEQTVGTTPVALVFSGETTSINIQADETNLGFIYVGKSDVTSAGLNAIAKLDGEGIFNLNYDDSENALFVVGSIAGQKYVAGALKND